MDCFGFKNPRNDCPITVLLRALRAYGDPYSQKP